MTMRGRLPLGRILATPGALETAKEHNINLVDLMLRHQRGDWGTVDDEDQATNDQALEYGSRILSAYGEGDAKLWIITEADRASTTILRPDEY